MRKGDTLSVGSKDQPDNEKRNTYQMRPFPASQHKNRWDTVRKIRGDQKVVPIYKCLAKIPLLIY